MVLETFFPKRIFQKPATIFYVDPSQVLEASRVLLQGLQHRDGPGGSGTSTQFHSFNFPLHDSHSISQFQISPYTQFRNFCFSGVNPS